MRELRPRVRDADTLSIALALRIALGVAGGGPNSDADREPGRGHAKRIRRHLQAAVRLPSDRRRCGNRPGVGLLVGQHGPAPPDRRASCGGSGPPRDTPRLLGRFRNTATHFGGLARSLSVARAAAPSAPRPPSATPPPPNAASRPP